MNATGKFPAELFKVDKQTLGTHKIIAGKYGKKYTVAGDSRKFLVITFATGDPEGSQVDTQTVFGVKDDPDNEEPARLEQDSNGEKIE